MSACSLFDVRYSHQWRQVALHLERLCFSRRSRHSHDSARIVCQLVLAAKITHVPSLMLSEQLEPLKGTRDGPINALRLIGQRARERGADTFVVFDTHWISNFGFHINANSWHSGSYTSPEAPHMISDITYDFPGNSELADLIAAETAKDGPLALAHKVRQVLDA